MVCIVLAQDLIIELWTKMLEADQVHDDTIVKNVETMQKQADEAVKVLRELLAKLHAIALSAVASAGGIAATEAELYAELSREKLARADLQTQLDRMKAAHDPCPSLIAALRKQIKEIKDAMDLDMDMLEKATKTVVVNSMELEKELQTRVKLGGAGGGRIKLGACASGSLPLPSRDDEAVVEDKKMHASTFTGIVSLRKELDALRKAHAPCAATLQAMDDQIQELKAHVARLDKRLAEELEKEEALAKDLGEEKRKEVELEKSLTQVKLNWKKTLKDLAEDKKMIASKDTEIADLKKRLDELEKKHSPCDDLITFLRKQIATLEMSSDNAKVYLFSCSLVFCWCHAFV